MILLEASTTPRRRGKVKVWFDDEREAPAGWSRVAWPWEIALPEAGQVDEISLDHDLGDDARGTGPLNLT